MPHSINLTPNSYVLVTADGRSIDPTNSNCRATQRYIWEDPLNDLDEPLAFDAEFQEFRPKGQTKWDNRLGRFAFTTTLGETVIDCYVVYDHNKNIEFKVPPPEFGVTKKDLVLANGARTIHSVRKDLNRIMANRTIVAHGGRFDLRSLHPELHVKFKFVDTQHMYGQIKLSTLAEKWLKIDIQEDVHDPTEDARATMGLYLLQHPYKGRTGIKKFEYKAEDYPALGMKGSISQSTTLNSTSIANVNGTTPGSLSANKTIATSSTIASTTSITANGNLTTHVLTSNTTVTTFNETARDSKNNRYDENTTNTGDTKGENGSKRSKGKKKAWTRIM